jgi:Transcription factor WhiB
MERTTYTNVSIILNRKASFTDHPYYDQRECKDVPVDVFFPDESTASARRNALKEAGMICNLCVVRDACLETAEANKEQDGFFGGKDFFTSTRTRTQNNKLNKD